MKKICSLITFLSLLSVTSYAQISSNDVLFFEYDYTIEDDIKVKEYNSPRIECLFCNKNYLMPLDGYSYNSIDALIRNREEIENKTKKNYLYYVNRFESSSLIGNHYYGNGWNGQTIDELWEYMYVFNPNYSTSKSCTYVRKNRFYKFTGYGTNVRAVFNREEETNSAISVYKDRTVLIKWSLDGGKKRYYKRINLDEYNKNKKVSLDFLE